MTDTLTPGSDWLLPVMLKHVSRNQKTAVTFFGFEHDESEVLIPLSVNSLIPASRLADLEAEVARWQQLYEDARHDLTKAEMEVERLREALAAWMGKNSYATGHGETFDDLLSELDWQHAKRINP